jgi:hypothetical protein
MILDRQQAPSVPLKVTLGPMDTFMGPASWLFDPVENIKDKVFKILRGFFCHY